LGEAGVDKNLAHRARMAASQPEAEFEASVQQARAKARRIVTEDEPDPEPTPPPEAEETDVEAEAREDAAAALVIVEADDKLAAAHGLLTGERQQKAAALVRVEHLSAELAGMTREAKRWKRKAERAAKCPACRAALGAE
jgi:hypothetical protein